MLSFGGGAKTLRIFSNCYIDVDFYHKLPNLSASVTCTKTTTEEACASPLVSLQCNPNLSFSCMHFLIHEELDFFIDKIRYFTPLQHFYSALIFNKVPVVIGFVQCFRQCTIELYSASDHSQRFKTSATEISHSTNEQRQFFSLWSKSFVCREKVSIDLLGIILFLPRIRYSFSAVQSTCHSEQWKVGVNLHQVIYDLSISWPDNSKSRKSQLTGEYCHLSEIILNVVSLRLVPDLTRSKVLILFKVSSENQFFWSQIYTIPPQHCFITFMSTLEFLHTKSPYRFESFPGSSRVSVQSYNTKLFVNNESVTLHVPLLPTPRKSIHREPLFMPLFFHVPTCLNFIHKVQNLNKSPLTSYRSMRQTINSQTSFQEYSSSPEITSTYNNSEVLPEGENVPFCSLQETSTTPKNVSLCKSLNTNTWHEVSKCSVPKTKHKTKCQPSSAAWVGSSSARRSSCVLDAVSALLMLCAYVSVCVLARHEVEGAQLEAINSGPIHPVRGVKGGRAYLPCDVTPLHANDRHVLVLWYKDGIGTPIHSHDSRRTGGRTQEWSDMKTFGERVRFDLLSTPSSLVLERLKTEDAGLYRCRVDFKRSPTRNARANLTVIIPPSPPVILLPSGQTVYGVVGPYDEGSPLKLICETTDGDPPPDVVWRLGHQVVDTSYEWPRPGLATNALTISELQREHLHASLICEASNTNLTVPVSTMVTIEMNLKPATVQILGAHEPLSAGRDYDIACQSSHGRPPALLSWYLDGELIPSSTPVGSSSNNKSLSTARIHATASLNTVSLTCRARSPVIKHRPIEDTWKLEIYYPPQIDLRLGSSLSPDNIREGTDVYFECFIKSNPRVYKIEWFHNNVTVLHNVSGGMIVSNQSLAVQKVRRAQAGTYACAAANTEGDARSQDLQLAVQYRPSCSRDQVRVYGAAREETITVSCRLDAAPPVVAFSWRFNSSGDVVDLQDEYVASDGLSSLLQYTVKSELDYGTLLCWGSNSLGMQLEPCVFRVVPAEPPDVPENCTLRNHPNETLSVLCEPGYDGGLKQEFVAEVVDMRTRRLILNITETAKPYFQLVGLAGDTVFVVRVYARNSKGRSAKKILRGSTDKDFTERYIAPVRNQPSNKFSSLPLPQILGCVVGIIGCLVLVALVAVLVVRLKDRKQPSKLKVAAAESKDEDPDLIPNRGSEDDTRLTATPVEGGFTDAHSLRSSEKAYSQLALGHVLSYPEVVYQIQSHQHSPESHQALVVSPEELEISCSPVSQHHILPKSVYPASTSPTHSQHTSSPTPSGDARARSPPISSIVPTVAFRSPSHIIYTAASYPDGHRVNPKEYYEPLQYPPTAYHVPISIPLSQAGPLVYTVPGRSSVSSDHSPGDSLQFSDTEVSDSSSSLRSRTRHMSMPSGTSDSTRLLALSPGHCISVASGSPSAHALVNSGNSSQKTNCAAIPGSGFGYKVESDDHGVKSSLVRPPTTKKRELPSALSPLLANQKESEV